LAGKIKFRLILSVFVLFSYLSAQNNLPHLSLVEELGCGNCHIGAQKSNIVLQRAPDLSYARLKYNEAYLFDYLGASYKFRDNIGKSRMPNFGFSDDEALAEKLGEKVRLYFPPLQYATDNAAMIGALALRRLEAGHRDDLELVAEAQP